MKTLEWLNNIIDKGLLCLAYREKVSKVRSKKQIFEICADTNGVSFLPEMREKGYPLPYEVIQEEFERYINGKYKPKFEPIFGQGYYTSAIYCGCDKEVDIVIDTTLACFLNCTNEVWIQQFNYTRLVVDQNSSLKIHCPQNSKAIIEVYGEGKVEIVEGEDRVKIRRR